MFQRVHKTQTAGFTIIHTTLCARIQLADLAERAAVEGGGFEGGG
jgi:hypothetical protein